MTLSDLWPFVLIIPALLGGAGLGWWLRAARRGQPASVNHVESAPAGSNAAHAVEGMDAQGKVDSLRVAEAEMPQLEARLSYLTKAVALARQQLTEADQEYDHLLMALDERRAALRDTQGDLATVHQQAQPRAGETDQLLGDIDRNIEELDMLVKMQESYNAKINRLTQQVQWQDGELRMLRDTVRARTAEIEEARTLLEQRESELRMLSRQRAQRDIDIEHARQMIGRKDDELRTVLGGRAADPFAQPPPSPEPPQNIAETNASQLPARRVPPPPPASPVPPLSPKPRRRPAANTGEPVSLDFDEPEPAPPSRAVLPAPEAPAPSLPSEPDPQPDLVDEDEDDGPELLFPPDNDIAAIPRLAEYYAEQLRSQGVNTVEQLAERTPEEVTNLLTIPAHHSPDIEAWIRAARRIVQRHASREQKKQ